MFKTVIQDQELSTKLNKIIFNNNIECMDFNIFNKKGISLSGSYMLELYNNIYKDMDKIDINSNDLDIYIEFHKLSIYYFEELFMKLFISGYRVVTKKDKSTKIHKQYNNIIYDLYNMYKPKHCKNCQNCQLSQQNKYFSLAKYISKIISLENIHTGQKLDIIFIKCTIRQLLTESFDFDIVKNFVTLNTVYFYNKDAINNRIATMTSKHFKNRVVDNIYELNNFILRYKKYTNRGFKVFIDNNEIKQVFIDYIHKLLHIILNINLSKLNYIESKSYIDKNASGLLYSYYIKYFHINEQLMQVIYHPNNIHRILDMDMNLDDI